MVRVNKFGSDISLCNEFRVGSNKTHILHVKNIDNNEFRSLPHLCYKTLSFFIKNKTSMLKTGNKSNLAST